MRDATQHRIDLLEGVAVGHDPRLAGRAVELVVEEAARRESVGATVHAVGFLIARTQLTIIVAVAGQDERERRSRLEGAVVSWRAWAQAVLRRELRP